VAWLKRRTVYNSYQISTNFVEWFMGNRKVHLWFYINQALLWINMNESWNCPTTFDVSYTESEEHLPMI
jgi:hypothetical protein